MLGFGALPPEINSAMMYSGPGAGPMLAAGTGWSGLAADLYSVADSYRSVISGLTSGSWSGSSAMAMAAAAAQYATWLTFTAGQAEQSAGQARAAAAAFEAAFAMMVPPASIAANRVQLLVLAATNFFGQNTPAIAATEVRYAGMWVQDAVAMDGYAGAAAAAASTLTPFEQPPVNTNMAGLTNQTAAVAAAAADSAAQDGASELMPTMRKYLDATDFPVLHGGVAVLQGTWTAISGLLGKAEDSLSSAGAAAGTAASGLTNGVGMMGSTLAGGLGKAPAMWGAESGLAKASADFGRALPVGRLSVPPSWSSMVNPMGSAAADSAVSALPGLRPGLSDLLPGTGPGAEPAAMWGGMPLAQARTAQQTTRRIPVIPRMPSAG